MNSLALLIIIPIYFVILGLEILNFYIYKNIKEPKFTQTNHDTYTVQIYVSYRYNSEFIFKKQNGIFTYIPKLNIVSKTEIIMLAISSLIITIANHISSFDVMHTLKLIICDVIFIGILYVGERTKNHIISKYCKTILEKIYK